MININSLLGFWKDPKGQWIQIEPILNHTINEKLEVREVFKGLKVTFASEKFSTVIGKVPCDKYYVDSLTIPMTQQQENGKVISEISQKIEIYDLFENDSNRLIKFKFMENEYRCEEYPEVLFMP